MSKHCGVITYGDLLMFVYEPVVNRDKVMMLFSSTVGRRVTNIFNPGYLAVGNRMSIRNGRLVYEDRTPESERGWTIKRLEGKCEVNSGNTTYSLYTFEAEFTRDGSPAISHVVIDKLSLAPYSDVYQIFSTKIQNPSELIWGYIGEEKLKEVIEALKEVESKQA